ncbi:DUF1203 domain-containing protein [Ahrensia sp. R2A130]|uniref:DUF1203 domain-containing protein n=1 Tax=Ahrensia sp. R2A130 TaxID=744979 RepID=UPI0001E0AC7B|nr:DUF1203 domain-containing protein [Ahrensia sp. R2A130]EFL89676.1 conserved hypothetical protein [Ahrensia sp. R2A130]
MTLTFQGMTTTRANDLWTGGTDDHDNPPERQVSDGNGNPCRHCLQMIEEGEEFLVFSLRPFASRQPYAEQGPVFLHAEPCPAYATSKVPAVLYDSPNYILRGYGNDERIVYGSGAVRPQTAIEIRAGKLLRDDKITFVDV